MYSLLIDRQTDRQGLTELAGTFLTEVQQRTQGRPAAYKTVQYNKLPSVHLGRRRSSGLACPSTSLFPYPMLPHPAPHLHMLRTGSVR
jgi:hypothetical protein